MTKPPGRFETQDLYFAAFLTTADVKMLPPRWIDDRKRRCNFVFEDDGNGTIHRLQIEYINKASKVVARTYAENIKALKSLIHIPRDA